jgi:hypothetical protein
MEEDDMADDWVDGNALAGPLSELFGVDVTAAVGRCAGCGRTGPFAEARVHDRAPGLVARCVGCQRVLLRLVRAPSRAWLDLQGLAYLQFALPDDG